MSIPLVTPCLGGEAILLEFVVVPQELKQKWEGWGYRCNIPLYLASSAGIFWISCWGASQNGASGAFWIIPPICWFHFLSCNSLCEENRTHWPPMPDLERDYDLGPSLIFSWLMDATMQFEMYPEFALVKKTPNSTSL